ncbi:MAG: MarR family transcriptional regulator [Myxococcota bacterium]
MPPASAAALRDEAPDLATAIERYRFNWVGHLITLGEHLSRRIIERLERECGYARIRPSLGPFISLVWREPRPLVELAGQLAISRQACSKVARLAEEDGYVERVQAKKGDRAQSVRLTERGSRLAEDSIRLVLEEQATYEAWIGSSRLRRFNAASSALFYAMGLQNQTDAGLGETARESVGVLPVIADRVELELREQTRAKGHTGLQISHAKLIALIGDGAMSVSELARLQGVSRQATGVTVRNLESLGYVRKDSDETDGRAIRVRLSERGAALVFDTVVSLDELGEAFRAEIGPRRFADFANVAAEIRAALATEADLAEGAEASPPRSTAAALARSTPRDHELRAIASLLEEKLGAEAAGRLGRILCP